MTNSTRPQGEITHEAPVKTEMASDQNDAVLTAEQIAAGAVISDIAGAGPEATPSADKGEKPKSRAQLMREAQERAFEEREAQAERLTSHARKQREADLDDDDADPVESTVTDTSTQAQDSAKPQEAAKVTDNQPGYFTDDQGVQMVRLLVNGQLQVVPADKALAALSKLNAGDEKLRIAAAKERELAERETRIRQLEAQHQQSPQPPSPGVPGVDANRLMQEREAAYLRLYNGDESAVKDLVKLDTELAQLNKAATPQVDVETIVARQLNSVRAAAWDAQVVSDEIEFKSDPAFADVVGNPMIYDLACKEAARIGRESSAMNAGIRPLEIMRQAAASVRQGLGLNAATAPSVNTRAERKQALGTTVAGGGTGQPVKAQVVKPQAREMTYAESQRQAMDELLKRNGH